jgi:hypothetical protein
VVRAIVLLSAAQHIRSLAMSFSHHSPSPPSKRAPSLSVLRLQVASMVSRQPLNGAATWILIPPLALPSLLCMFRTGGAKMVLVLATPPTEATAWLEPFLRTEIGDAEKE